MLRGERDHHGRVLRPLRLVNRGRVGEDQLVELAEAVSDLASVELDHHLAGFGIDARMKPRSPLYTSLS